MFFVVDHYLYDDDTITITENTIECFICYEICCENEAMPIKLNSTLYYIKNCECDGFIHNKCLSLWHDAHKKCPICRTHMTKRKLVDIVELDNLRRILFFTFFCKIIRHVPLIIFILFVLHLHQIISINK